MTNQIAVLIISQIWCASLVDSKLVKFVLAGFWVGVSVFYNFKVM